MLPIVFPLRGALPSMGRVMLCRFAERERDWQNYWKRNSVWLWSWNTNGGFCRNWFCTPTALFPWILRGFCSSRCCTQTLQAWSAGQGQAAHTQLEDAPFRSPIGTTPCVHMGNEQHGTESKTSHLPPPLQTPPLQALTPKAVEFCQLFHYSNNCRAALHGTEPALALTAVWMIPELTCKPCWLGKRQFLCENRKGKDLQCCGKSNPKLKLWVKDFELAGNSDLWHETKTEIWSCSFCI